MFKNNAMGSRTVAERDDAIPLYRQVYLVLLEQIQRGEMGERAKMPTEMELCEMFKVSRITVRRALAELAQDKRIRRVQGLGAFVNKTVPTLPIPQTMQEFCRLPDSLRAISTAKLLSFTYVAPPPAVKTAMRLAGGARVRQSIRVRSYKGTPFFHLRIFTPEAIGSQFSRKDLEKDSLLSLLRKHAKVCSVEQRFGARLADPEVADALNIPTGSALFQITWIVRDEQENVIEYALCAARPDMYQVSNFLRLRP